MAGRKPLRLDWGKRLVADAASVGKQQWHDASATVSLSRRMPLQ
jgi:hypothetical protein